MATFAHSASNLNSPNKSASSFPNPTNPPPPYTIDSNFFSLSHDLMASACVNNNVGGGFDKNFFDSPSNSFDWFNPRSSSSSSAGNKPSPTKPPENLIDLDFSDDDTGDFEFRLEDPVKMLAAADELFSDGKLMPLHLSSVRTSNANADVGGVTSSSSSSSPIRSATVEEIIKSKVSSLSGMDPYLFSPKAPRCSSGWRELLGLKKLQSNSNSSSSSKHDNLTKTPSKSLNPASIKQHFAHKNTKFDTTLGLPLLREIDTESVEVERDLPRVSLNLKKTHSQLNHQHPPKVRLVRRDNGTNTSSNQTSSALGVSMDSPRMNSSGKVVFQSLERSSSSPSTFNGGPRVKYKGMERRSYSANVKVSPVLNVPVCSLRGSSKFGLGQLFPSPHRRPGTGTGTNSTDSSEKNHRSHHISKQKPSS